MENTIGAYISDKNQEVLRIKFLKWLKKNPTVYTDLATKVGVGRGTIFNFLNGKPVIYRTLVKFDTFLEDKP